MFDYSTEHFLKDRPILWVLTVTTAPGGNIRTHGLFIGEGRECFTEAVKLAQEKNIDFVEMFITALAVDSDPEVNYFSRCYGIDFDSHKITVDKNLCQVTPLILLHYVTLLEKLVKRGLKKGYVNQEENLNSKIRGRIYVPAHVQQNVCTQREDRAYCRFQEYTEDIPENRLLKKALYFAMVILRTKAKSRISRFIC